MTFLKKVFGGSLAPSKTPPIDHVAGAVGPEGGSVPTTPSPKLPFATAVDAAPSPPPRRPMLSFADFEVHRTLGTGSFGRVLLVLHRPSGQYFAMKKLRKSDVVRLKQVEHTNNERSLLAQVENPFIVRMAGTFQDERHLYIILEYVCGGELFSLLRKVRVRTARLSVRPSPLPSAPMHAASWIEPVAAGGRGNWMVAMGPLII